MMTASLSRVLLAFLILGPVACSDDDGPATGTERGPCFPNNTCNAGLICLSGLCVNFNDGSVADAGDGGLADLAPGDSSSDGPGPTSDIRPTSGTVSTVAGTGIPGFADGPVAAALLSSPSGVVVDGDTLYVADRDNHRIRKIDLKTGQVSTLAGDGQQGWLDGPGATAQLNAPTALALDGKGGLYVADAGNHRIRKVELASGQVSTFAGNGNPSSVIGSLLTASFHSPRGIAIDPWGDIYVADHLSNLLRKVSGGKVTNLTSSTSQLAGPAGLAVDSQGAVLIAEIGRHQITKYLSGLSGFAGSVKGFADGDAKFAKLNAPAGVALDAAGDLYVADTGNHAIRKVTQGNVVTLCGGTQGFQDGTLASAQLHLPYGIAVDPKGRIFVADTGNHRVRMIAP